MIANSLKFHFDLSVLALFIRTKNMFSLYPSIKSYTTHKLEVDDIHTLHIEECGNPDGAPILILHSGPGTGCENVYKRFFDPEKYRIILFDQRGGGHSTPHASLINNTTEHLIDDIESIREYLNVSKWYLFGNAWGSALSLLYAQEYPQNISGMILNCVFLARKKDIDWFYQKGANAIFPDHWRDFVKLIPKAERNDIIKAYAKLLNSGNELARMSAAKHWSLWQANCSSLQPHNNIIEHFSDPRFALGLACIESHYFSNNCFVEDNVILNNINKIRHLPLFIIHGRYDMICPLENAWQLHKKCPASELMIVRDAGHSIREPGVIDALILASRNILHAEPSAC